MKIKTTVDEATLGSVKQTSQFSIKASAKAFSILSSGLYSNKIKAIIRELSCNAYDAHVMNGNPEEPFTVKLPNKIDPSFYVRDYGIGLAHADVVNLYTTYFESTKQDSNDYVGALGLGSKSPFSYTQNFSVISIKDGWKGIYTAYIDNMGCPAIALMAEENDVDERNGLEVRFSVNDHWDMRKFAEEASEVFKWFKTKPEVTGDSYFSIGEIEYSERDIIPGVHLRDYNNRYSNMIAIQGNIAYPMDISDSEELGDLRYLLSQPLVMEFEIGELDIAASREKLSFDEDTIANIKKKLQEIHNGLYTFCKDKIKGITNQWELKDALQVLHSSRLFEPSVNKMVDDGICKLLQRDRGYLKKTDILLLKEGWLDKKGINLINLRKSHGYHSSNFTPQKMVVTTEKDKNDQFIKAFDIPLNEKLVFILNNKKTGPRNRVKQHFKGDRHSGCTNYVIFSMDDKNADLESEFKKLKKRLLNPPNIEVYKIDDLDKPEAKRAKIGAGLLELEKHNSWHRGDYYRWDSAVGFEEDEEETYYYVPMSNYTILKPDNETPFEHKFLNAWEIIRDSNMAKEIFPLYGVRKSYIKNLDGRENWVNAFTIIEKELKSLETKVLIQSHIQQELNRQDMIKKLRTYKHKIENDDSMLMQFIEKYEDYFNTSSVIDISGYRDLYKMFGLELPDVEDAKEEFDKSMKDLKQRYTLLSDISHYTDVERVLVYVNQIDELIAMKSEKSSNE